MAYHKKDLKLADVVFPTDLSYGEDLRPYYIPGGGSVEKEVPAPYVGGRGAIENKLGILKPFVFEVVSYQCGKSLNGYEKRFLIQVRVRPRDDDSISDDPDGKYLTLDFSGSYDEWIPEAVCLRDLCLRAMRHELEENLYADGVRVWDPHVGHARSI